jgi:hypothetical protein
MVDDADGRPKAVRVDELSDTETERQLEDLLVASPDLLVDGLTIVARQLQTAGGPLDLVGIDDDGRLVIFELKRGVLTRDAVAQVIDYASDIESRDVEDIARTIQEHSGQRGVERIDDFLDWYGREYPDAQDALEKVPRMVLVGLGADVRATRMVNFLASAGIDIQLLTFHAFRSNGRLLLGRQTESQPPKPKSSATGSKEENLKILLDSAEEVGSRELLLTVADFMAGEAPFYRWPGKTAFSFSLPERTTEGRPTSRSYFTLWVDKKKPGSVVLTMPERVLASVAPAVERFVETLPDARKGTSSWLTIQLVITPNRWMQVKEALVILIRAIRDHWEQATAAEQRAEVQAAGSSGEV